MIVNSNNTYSDSNNDSNSDNNTLITNTNTNTNNNTNEDNNNQNNNQTRTEIQKNVQNTNNLKFNENYIDVDKKSNRKIEKLRIYIETIPEENRPWYLYIVSAKEASDYANKMKNDDEYVETEISENLYWNHDENNKIYPYIYWGIPIYDKNTGQKTDEFSITSGGGFSASAPGYFY